MASNRHVVSVLIADRVGILRDVTSAVAELGANIDGISQTVLEGFFTVILTTTFDTALDARDIREAIASRLAVGEAAIDVRPIPSGQGGSPTVDGERFIVTLAGADRRGILKAVMTFLADHGVNVEDWDVLHEADLVTYIGELTVPRDVAIEQLQAGLQSVVSPLGLTSGIQHENIFRATSEVGAISHLLSGDA